MIAFDQTLSWEDLAEYQMKILGEQVRYARTHSPFYREYLAGFTPVRDWTDLHALPFTREEHLLDENNDFLCIGPDALREGFTARTLGTEGPAKQVFFSQEDLRHTLTFFRTAMAYYTGPGKRVVVALPALEEKAPSRLLLTALAELGAEVYPLGPIDDLEEAARLCRAFRPQTILGLPCQLRRLALYAPDIKPENLLLSADYVANSISRCLSRLWECQVFQSYGFTESGFGCAVECPTHRGLHLRNDELVLEIIDPATGLRQPPGGWGEIVFSTLRREAMPLIRYRTGDWGRCLATPCGCGSLQPRLDYVGGRIAERKKKLSIYGLDEALLTLDAVWDYQAFWEKDKLHLIVAGTGMAILEAKTLLKKIWPTLKLKLEPGQPALHNGFRKRQILGQTPARWQ